MKPGRYTNVLENDYHSGPGVSKSDLDLINRSPLHYIHAKQNPSDKDTPAMMLGRALHCAVLEPDRFSTEYCCELTKDDYPDALVSKDDMVTFLVSKGRGLVEYLEEEISECESSIMEIESDRSVEEQKIKDAMAAIDPKAFKTKKEYNTATKPLKVKLKNWVTQSSGWLRDSKERMKLLKERLREYKANLRGTKAQLAAEIRKLDRTVVIFDEKLEEHKARYEGYTVLKKADYDTIGLMYQEIQQHPAADILFKNGTNEVSYYWNDKKTGELCRGRLDKETDDGWLIDFKTTTDASLRACQRDIVKRRYHVQAAHYSDGYEAIHGKKPKGFLFVFCEKEAPYAMSIVKIDEEWMNAGLLQRNKDLSTYSYFKKIGWWPGYDGTIQTISMPGYEYKKYQELLESSEGESNDKPS